MRRLSAILFVFVFLAGMAACHSKPNDKAISQEILHKIAERPVTQGSQVSVTSHDGEVTLIGRTRTVAAKREIVRIAKEEPGVSSVEDETSVGVGKDYSSTAERTAPTVPVAAPPPPPPPPPPVVVPGGTLLTVRTNEPLSTKTVKTGTFFTGALMTPITLEGRMAIPQGAKVTGVVIAAKKAGKFKGGASLTLALESLTVRGHKYNIVTEYFAQESKGKGKRTAVMIGAGAGTGAAIGGAAAGGTGAAIGALAGATAGTLGSLTGKRDIELPAESALIFKLDLPLKLRPHASRGE